MFKKIAIITIILGLLISVNLFAGEEDNTGPWIQVSADDDIEWHLIIYGGGVGGSNWHIYDSGTKLKNVPGAEGCLAEIFWNGNLQDSGTVPINGTLYLEIDIYIPDPDEPETY